MGRLEYNLKILNVISTLIHKYPELRFGQVLVDLGVIQLVPADKQLVAIDPFNEEPNKTWERVKEKIKKFI